MNNTTQMLGAQSTWFVGATFDGTDDQLPRFLADGIWENGYEDKHLDVVRLTEDGRHDRLYVFALVVRRQDDE